MFIDQSQLWAIPVNAAAGELQCGPAEALFPIGTPGGVRHVTPPAVSRAGQRFSVARNVYQPDSIDIHVRRAWLKP